MRRKYGKFGVVGYVNSSYAGDFDNKNSITKYCFFLGRDIVTWCSKQQCIVSISTSEAKYVAMSHRARESIWIQRLLNQLLPKQAIKRIEILGDNETSLILTRNLESQNCIKHIDVIYHHIQELVENRKLAIKWISSSNMLADGLSKALPAGLFKRYWKDEA